MVKIFGRTVWYLRNNYVVSYIEWVKKVGHHFKFITN